MKYLYNSINGVVCQEFETQPDFECWENTPELELQISLTIRPKIIDGVVVENASLQEILNYKNNLRQQIYSVYDSLFESSLARALDKVGQGLNLTQMQSLRQEYELKKDVALEYMQQGTGDSNMMAIIQFECDVDFAEPMLSQEVAYLNQILIAQGQPTIPTNQTRLYQFCNLIVVKWNLGSQIWNTLRALCATFRSKLITDLDNNQFNRIKKRIEFVKTITNDTTIEEFINMQTDFDAITND